MERELSLVINNQNEEELLKHIDWNKNEFIELVKSITAQYQGLTYTDDQMKSAKGDRAKLNAMKKAISDRRIEVKKAIMHPYETFEAEVKEVVALIEEPINMIDSQIKQYEEEEKEKRRHALVDFFEKESKEFSDFLSFDAIFDKKYLNVSVTLNKAREEMKAKIDRIRMDVGSIKSFASEKYYMAAMDVYKRTLDVNSALAEDKKLTEFGRKAEEERKQREAREEERRKAEEERRQREEKRAEEERQQRELEKRQAEEERLQREEEKRRRQEEEQAAEIASKSKVYEQEQFCCAQESYAYECIENPIENMEMGEHAMPKADVEEVCINTANENVPSLQWCDLMNMSCSDMDNNDFDSADCNGDCEVCCHCDMQHLKPCPFCGKSVEVHGGSEDWKPSFSDPDSGGNSYFVACDCGLHFSSGSYELTDFANKWNKRWMAEDTTKGRY